jgi:hypothetical protein
MIRNWTQDRDEKTTFKAFILGTEARNQNEWDEKRVYFSMHLCFIHLLI